MATLINDEFETYPVPPTRAAAPPVNDGEDADGADDADEDEDNEEDEDDE